MAAAELSEKILTAMEFLRFPDGGFPRELVRGRIMDMNLPAPRHGYYCGRIARFVGNFAEDEKDLGRVVTNDSGVITEHDPDTVRGPDVSYYSYERLPKGPFPEGYLDIVPDAAFEVRSPSEVWARTLERVQELLDAGVKVVCVLDPRTESVSVFQNENPPAILYKGDVLTLAAVLPGFELPVSRIFE